MSVAFSNQDPPHQCSIVRMRAVEMKRKTPCDAQRITDLRRGSYASARATEKLMRSARDEGVPQAVSRTTYWRARKRLLGSATVYGPLVQDFTLPLRGGPKTFAVQQPAAMLYTALDACEPFRNFFTHRYDMHKPSASSPWHIIMYCDEIGHNPVGRDNRKCESIYWSFHEFGGEALHSEACWFKIMVVRSQEVAKLDGHMSHLFRLLLNHHFFGEHSFADGVVVGPGQIMYATFGFVIADEKALKEVLFAKGAAGFKFCPCCHSMCDHKATDERKTGCISGDCLNVAQIEGQLNSDNSVRAIVLDLADQHARRARGEITQDAYDQTSIFYGWNYNPNMLLMCESLKLGAISMLMHDHSHVYTISGIFQIEMQYVLIYLNSCTPDGNQFFLQELDKFVRGWQWPKSMANCSRVFSVKLDLTKDHFKCDSHEATQIYSIVAVFLRMLPNGMSDSAPVRSFIALADVLDLLRLAKNGIDADLLFTTILKHLRAFQLAYHKIGWVPKHHLAYHLPTYLKKWGTLLSTLTQERMHKVVKRWSADRFAKTSFERGLMEELTLEHLHQLKHPWWFGGLQEPLRKPYKKMQACLQELYPSASEFLTAGSFRTLGGSVIHAGDVAFAMHDQEPVLCNVWWFARVDGRGIACVSFWARVENAPRIMKTHCVSYRKADAPTIVRIDSLQQAATFWDQGDLVVALAPVQL